MSCIENVHTSSESVSSGSSSFSVVEVAPSEAGSEIFCKDMKNK